MPLPDERPRQSVANLIARLENQTKRQTPNNTALPRSSSVVSHHTGESVNHDIKEKREWPPKSIGERITSLDSSPVVHTSLTTSQSAPQPLIPPMISKPEAAPLVEVSNKDPKPPTEPERKDDTEVPVAQPSKQASPTTPSRTHTTAKSLSTKTSPTIANKSTTRAPRQSMGPPAILPLKPQHTGMSTASTGSTRKPTVKPTSSANPRTPARPVAATASSPPMRPKTPSSGLFAPTAASLAKSRSVTSTSTTTPAKKIALSASSSDRLSKPTAASLSKARTPLPPVPPIPATPKQTRSNAKPASGTPGPPKAGPKAKAMSPSSKTQPLPKKGTADATSGATNVAATVEAEQLETNGTPDPANGHSVKEQVADSTAPIDLLSQETSGSVEASDATSQEFSLMQPELDSSLEIAVLTVNGDSSQPHPSDTNVVEKDVAKEPPVQQRDDIESMVNLLESLPARNARPISIASIPDDVHEIPDEE